MIFAFCEPGWEGGSLFEYCRNEKLDYLLHISSRFTKEHFACLYFGSFRYSGMVESSLVRATSVVRFI